MIKNFLAYLVLSSILIVVLVIGYDPIIGYYKANPYINGVILLTLIVGFLIYSIKIISLSSEYRSMNSVAFGKLKINDTSLNNYPITKNIAKNLGIISRRSRQDSARSGDAASLSSDPKGSQRDEDDAQPS